MFVGHRRQLGGERQTEIAIDPLNETNQVFDLIADLLLRDKAVRVILRELADARQSRQHARSFVAMQRRLLVKSNRQVAIASHFASENEHVARAVHRLYGHLLVLGLDEKHVLPVVLPMAGGFPESLVKHQRRLSPRRSPQETGHLRM